MAEESPSSSASQTPPLPPSYLEVNCRSSGKTRRFAAGTDAGFAVALINRKLKKGGVPVALHIEAVKDGEEPIAFGPNSVLSHFSDGWKLQTVTQTDLFSPEEIRDGDVRSMPMQTPVLVSGVPRSERRVSEPIGLLYIVKIVLAFMLIFLLGAVFTLFLDNLPALILFFKSIF